MSDSAQREWRYYLDDMIGFAQKVIAYTDGLDQTGFIASSLNYDATVRNLKWQVPARGCYACPTRCGGHLNTL